MKIEIEAGDVIRWFLLSWPEEVLCRGNNWIDINHNKLMDTMHEETNAVEVCSGHTGVLVALGNDDRSDEEIIASLMKRLEGLKIFQ